MKVTELPGHWESPTPAEERRHDYGLRLPLEDAARVAALAELYPHRSEPDILNDLIGAALDDLAEATPLRDKLSKR